MGYVVKGHEDKVVKLKNVIYKFIPKNAFCMSKKVPRVCNSGKDKYLKENTMNIIPTLKKKMS